MRTATILSALPLLALTTAQATLIDGSIDGPIVPGTTGKLGNATITQDNPLGVTYSAVLPDSNTTGIRGYVAGTSNSNGTGVVFNINLYGFPSEALGPFLYHIHSQPVPSSGDCSGTLAHLDPTERGETPPCDPTQPEECQVGDLAGKHGNITLTPFQTTYLELYTTTLDGPGAFFGNRSLVIHSSNTTRLTCANFTLQAGSVVPNQTDPTTTATTATTTTTAAAVAAGPVKTQVPYTGAAVAQFISAGVLVAAGMAFLL
ncbi:hypothetical protein MMC08_008537 [Hypocenomyce scalaris]|nr:hypothetical protein [Hypocenomyce scalaris]